MWEYQVSHDMDHVIKVKIMSQAGGRQERAGCNEIYIPETRF